MPVKKSVRSKKSAKSAAVKPARSNAPAGTATRHAGAIVFIMVGVFAAAMLFAARDVPEMDETESADARAAFAAAPAPSQTPATASKSGGSKQGAVQPVSATSTAAPADRRPAPPASSMPALVTITGCVERSGANYELTQTEGADAPKARSWKMGFLKKGSASVDLRNAVTAVHLSEHVGRRVSVTGTLDDRQMTVHSVRRIAASCK